MKPEEFVANFLVNHLGTTITLLALAGSIRLATFLAKKWPLPPPTAPWWKRLAHFLLVNWPSWGNELEGDVRGVAVNGKPVPFVGWTKRTDENPINQARVVLNEKEPKKDGGYIDSGILLCIGAIGFVLVVIFCGCAPEKAYVRALQIKGEASDTLVAAHVGWNQLSQARHDSIVRDAPSLDVGLARLAAWENGGAKRVVAALIGGRAAVQKLSEALEAVGAAKRRDWAVLTVEVVAAISTMVATLAEFGVHVDWLPPNTNTGGAR